mmetsp:Transcript_27493/g.32087  ORF Transcript_27493/g.32087 Transcript_27493/m.32087 type:complete len:167 (+) Transcript_27493:275-775(+)
MMNSYVTGIVCKKPQSMRSILKRIIKNTSIIHSRSLSSVEQQETTTKGDRITNILTRAIDAQPRTPPEPTPEEAKRRYDIGRNYVIGNFRQHNEIHHDLACKIRMKNHAIKMLPRENDEKYGYIRTAALNVDVDDDSMPPYYRPIPVDTAPIPGFDPSTFINDDEE